MKRFPYHPHVHIVIPGVVLDARNKLVRFPAKPDYPIKWV